MDTFDHVYSVYIKAPPDRVWRAITDGDETVRYYYGTRVASDWAAGLAADLRVSRRLARRRREVARDRAGPPVVDVLPPALGPRDRGRRAGPDDLAGRAGRGGWLEAHRHERARAGLEVGRGEFAGGIVYIVSGLKTLVETGEPLASADVAGLWGPGRACGPGLVLSRCC